MLLENIQNLIKQHPESVALLLKRHGVKASPTNRNVANAIKVLPEFFKALKQAAGGDNVSNLTGDENRFTLADRLANAGIVFSNVIRDTQRQPERYNQRVPAYYEPTGKYNVMSLPAYQPASSRFFGMDKKLLWLLGIALAIVVIFEMRKH